MVEDLGLFKGFRAWWTVSALGVETGIGRRFRNAGLTFDEDVGNGQLSCPRILLGMR